MYLIVMILNVFVVSRYKLIDLLTGGRKNEKIKVKNPFISILIFIISLIILGYAYYQVTENMLSLNLKMFLTCIVLGIIGTIMFFWSMSGFILKLVQLNKKLYFKNLNMFVLRQINSKINTTVLSMSVICILLFFTITIFSSAMSLNQSIRKDLEELTPMDLQALQYSNEESNSVLTDLENSGLQTENLKNIVEVAYYRSEEVTVEKGLGQEVANEYAENFKYRNQMPEPLMKLSDYNKVAQAYGHKTYTLKDNEYLVVADYDEMIKYHNMALANEVEITLNGQIYEPKYNQIINGFVEMSTNHANTGIFVFPDQALDNSLLSQRLLLADYNANNENAYEKIESQFQKTIFPNNLSVMSKTVIYDSSRGLGTIVTFIGLYLGIIFLISSAAILALKELSESSDNKERYQVLRKIGTDEKMINRSLFKQIGIFFLVPLLLAIIHSIFGIKCANIMLAAFGKEDMLNSVMMTAILIIVIYGGYFLVTYFSSKRIIKEK